MNKHELYRSPFGTWKCKHCNFIAETRAKLKEHLHKEHPQFSKHGWNKGLTQETNSIIKRTAKKLSKRYISGELINPFKGKHHSEETKKRISNAMLKAHAEGRASSWIGKRKLSYAEQSWFNIFINEFGKQTFINNYYVKECHYWLDFAWPEKRIYFEVDGRFHYTKEGIEYDTIRTQKLLENGWTLIGRCNWPEYQKLSKEEKNLFVKSIISKIK